MNTHENLDPIERKLADTFYRNSQFNALTLAVTGVGFLVIYFLGYFGVLGEPAQQLLYIAGAVFFLALTQLILRNQAKAGHGSAVNLYATILVGIFAILLVSFWAGIGLIAGVIALVTPVQAIRSNFPSSRQPALAAITAAMLALLAYANTNPLGIERLQTNSTIAIASLAFLSTTGILLLTTFLIAQSTRFRSLQNQLLTSFALIIIIPMIMMAILSAIGSFANNQRQTLDTLEAVSRLKQTLINNALEKMQNDAVRLLNDQTFATGSLRVLRAAPEDSAGTINNSKLLVRARIQDILPLEYQDYAEFMVVNNRGEVLISSLIGNEGINLNAQQFFKLGLIEPTNAFSNFPSFGSDNLVTARPIYDLDGQTIRGLLVLRTSNDIINNLLETTAGVENVETYLVNTNLVPLSALRSPSFSNIVNTQATTEGIQPGFQGGSGVYDNYTGEPVLGYYTWNSALRAVFITEIPTSSIASNSFNAIAGSAIIAIVIVLIAFTAVITSAQALLEPIRSLVQTSQQFAAGNLAARAEINRVDEIGTLGRAYNNVAEQLQDLIGRLEQRVADRTLELEGQTLRLRVAAEIAKDAASARDISNLLDRAGKLIVERFEFYHVGIFLLDSGREYAVLTASPTEAGRQMIANGHKLRVGETGIVGRVASTGEPRISLNTEIDSTYFNHAYLPDTRSEMALPLSVEGNVIGVLDIQSREPNAFNAEDIAILQVLADQLATAIERTRLLQQVEQNLRELEQTYGRITSESWRTLSESKLLSESGYRFDNLRIQPLKQPPAEALKAIETGGRIIEHANGKTAEETVAIPIKIRGQVIGAVSVKLKEGYTPATVRTLEQAIDRLAGSLESARLFEEARLRADREQAIAQITSSISAATNFDSILRTTVEEIGKSLGETEVNIRIISGNDR